MLCYTHNNVDGNSVFTKFDIHSGKYDSVTIGDMDKFQSEYPNVMLSQIADLLWQGHVTDGGDLYCTFEWRIGDTVEKHGAPFYTIKNVKIDFFNNSECLVDLHIIDRNYSIDIELGDFMSKIRNDEFKIVRNYDNSPQGNDRKCNCPSYDLFHFGCKCGGK